MCLADFRNGIEFVILSSTPDTSTPSSFVVDHDLTIPQMDGFILQNIYGFMCYAVGTNLQIFNPATRQLVTLSTAFILPGFILPPGEEEANIIRTVSYYLGHDPVDDQYKVVCSTTVCSKLLQDMRSEHWVFVLKPGQSSWKKAAPTPPDFCPHVPNTRGLCIDGVIYYLGWIGMYSYVIVSFHIRSEEFRMFKVPRKDGDEPGRLVNLCLIEYGGKVTLLDQTNLRGKGMLDLWVVEDATNEEWSRKTLVLQPSQLHLVQNTTTYKLKGTTQNGKLLLMPRDFLSPFHCLCL